MNGFLFLIFEKTVLEIIIELLKLNIIRTYK